MRKTLSRFNTEHSELRPGFLPADVYLAYPEKTGLVRVTVPPRR